METLHSVEVFDEVLETGMPRKGRIIVFLLLSNDLGRCVGGD